MILDQDKSHEELVSEINDLKSQLSELQNRHSKDQKRLESIDNNKFENRSIIDSIPAMIWCKDKNNTILHANYYAAKSLGKTVEEVEGKSTFDLYPQDGEKYYQDDLEVIESQKPKIGIVERYIEKDGKETWVRTNKVPLHDNKGDIVGVIVVAIDITELKEKEERIKTLHELLPMCACCKKIRDDQGYWQKLERYLAETAHMEFSHGLCPECLENYRSDFVN